MGKLSLFLHLALTFFAVDAKSPKRGIAYDLQNEGDMAALSRGVSWWHNWHPKKSPFIPDDYRQRFGMEFVPFLWNDQFNEDQAVNAINSVGARYFLALNEPNLMNQAKMTPEHAARIWLKYERVAARTGAKIVGPQMTFGDLPGYKDPVRWMDDFIDHFWKRNGRAPRIDALGFHWLDYGLDGHLNRMTKYGKKFWVTEMANMHYSRDPANIDSVWKQKDAARDMINICERRSDVERYAWLSGRWTENGDRHKISLLASGEGALTELGKMYARS